MDQIGQLYISSTSLMAHGNTSASTSTLDFSGESWIVDFGAFEHMPGTRSLFFHLFNRTLKIIWLPLLINLVPLIVHLSHNIILRDVLFVPKLS